MGAIRYLTLVMLGLFTLSAAACGSSEMTPEQQKELNDFWARSSLRFVVQGESSASGSIVSEPEKPTKQVMVRGNVDVTGYAGGAITIEVREAEACAEGYCPVEGKSPLASTVVNQPGFFSLVVPSKGQKVSLTGSTPGHSGLKYLGELSAAVSGIEFTLK